MRILVTGCGGFIGSHLCERLLQDGHDVVGVQRLSRDPGAVRVARGLQAVAETAKAAPGVWTLVRGALTDAADVDECLDHGPFDGVVHLAAQAGVRTSLEHPVSTSTDNIIGTQTLLRGLLQRGYSAAPFVFASSSSVYGPNPGRRPQAEYRTAEAPLSPYAVTKLAGELCLRQQHAVYGGSFAALRFFSVYGPRQRPDLVLDRFTEALLDGRLVTIYGTGMSARDYTHVSDVVNGIVLSLAYLQRTPGACQAFNIGSGRPVRLLDLLGRLIAEVFPHDDQALVQDLLTSRGLIVYNRTHPCDVDQTWADLTKAREHLGYAPGVDFAAGVRAFVAWKRAFQRSGAW